MQAHLRQCLYPTRILVVFQALFLSHMSGPFHEDDHLLHTGITEMMLQSIILTIPMCIDLITGQIVDLPMTVYHQVRTALNVLANLRWTQGIVLEAGDFILNHIGRVVHLFEGSLC